MHREERSMTGLRVLYAKEATEEREWVAIPDRDRTGRLREVYWARCAESKLGRKSFFQDEARLAGGPKRDRQSERRSW